MAGNDITVVEQGDYVVASRDASEEELRASITEEPKEKESGTPAAPVKEPAKESEAEETLESGEDRDAQGRFVKPVKPPVERRSESIQARIDRLRHEQGEEERRLERLRAERQQLETGTPKPPATTPTSPQAGTAPTFKEFVGKYAAEHPDATYEDAIDAHQALREAALLAKFKQDSQQSADQQELQTRLAAHNQRVAEAKAATPDWDTTVESAQVYLAQRGFAASLPPVLNEAILRSDRSEQIVRDLSVHPEIALQFAQDTQDVPVTTATVKLMRTVLESRLGIGSTAAPSTGPVVPPRQSRSNPPPKPVGSSPVTPDASADEPSYDAMHERVTKLLHRRG